MKNIAVVFGGVSVEHDISIITGVMTINALEKGSYKVVPIYVDKNGLWWTGEDIKVVENFANLNYKKLKRVTIKSGENKLFEVKGKRLKELCQISASICCMHGERGEDGSLAGLFNMCGIVNVNSSLLSSSLCMDKQISKYALKGIGVKTLPSITCTCIEEVDFKSIKYPVIVKPLSLGSSIGISTAKNAEELEEGLNLAFRYSLTAVIEPLLTDFIEINCGAYLSSEGIVVSECEQPVKNNSLLSFNDKYLGGNRIFPANIDKTYSKKIKKLTEKIYKSFNFIGSIRVDYMLKTDGEIYVNEINTTPGSLAYYLFTDTMEGFCQILQDQIQLSLETGAKQSSLTTVYKSSILNLKGSKGSKHL